MRTDNLTLWVIYERPSDYPDSYVVRMWHVTARYQEAGEAKAFPTLEEARAHIPKSLWPIPRSPEDDEKIVETWI